MIKAQITAARVASDVISTPLGPTSLSGTFNLWLRGSGVSDWYAVQSASRSGASYNDSFNLSTSTPAGNYATIYASWATPNLDVITTYNYTMDSLGKTHHSQYNTPYESQCSGSQVTAYIITNLSQCYGSVKTTTLKSDFSSQVTTNGTGASLRWNIVKAINATSCIGAGGAPSGANSSNTFVQVSSITGACNLTPTTSTVAAYHHACSQQIFIAHYGQPGTIKTVVDECPRCSTDPPHYDNYSTSQACSAFAVGDLPPTGYFETVLSPQ